MTATCDIPTPLGNVLISSESDGKVELRLGDLPTILTNGMVVDKAMVCVLRVVPDRVSTRMLFTAALENSAVEGFPETGESLDCQTWEDANWSLSIGTEDQDMLITRLPELGIPREPYPIQYSPSHIRLSLQGIQMDRPTTFHFIVAVKRRPDDRECSTWFAADIQHAMANKAVNWTP